MSTTNNIRWIPRLRVLPEESNSAEAANTPTYLKATVSKRSGLSSSSNNGEPSIEKDLDDVEVAAVTNDDLNSLDSEELIDKDTVVIDVGAEGPAGSNGKLVLQKNMPYELRNEQKSHKWYSFFNEYEYRLNKEYIQSRKWYQFLYPNHATSSPSERKLLYKLDLIIGLYFLMLCWSHSLDLSNYTNAYVSGMKEDLHMVKNDFVNTSSIATVGSIIFQIPFMYLLPKYPTHIVLPLMDFGWSWFTFACYKANNLAELRAYRFILNAFGSAYFPVSQYILGCWYGPDEITSRVFLFFCGQLLGGITSGLLQARIFKSLDGVCGLAGWRWMFLIDAVAISLPMAIMGFFLIPGTPEKCYSLILSDEEIRIARQRLKRFSTKDGGQVKLQSFFSWKMWKKVFGKPTFWILVVFDTCSWNNMIAFSGSYTLWLKSQTKYSIVQVNNLSVLPACIGFAYVALCSFGSDLLRCKWVFLVFSNIMCVISCAILIKWDVSSNAKWFAFMISYFSIAPSPCLWSFINDFLRLDPQVKAITWIAIYSFSASTYAWTPTLAWKTEEAPKFRTGYTVSLVFTIIYGFWTFVVLYYYKKTEKKNALINGIILYNDGNNDGVPQYVDQYLEQKGEYYYVKETLSSEKEISQSEN